MVSMASGVWGESLAGSAFLYSISLPVLTVRLLTGPSMPHLGGFVKQGFVIMLS